MAVEGHCSIPPSFSMVVEGYCSIPPSFLMAVEGHCSILPSFSMAVEGHCSSLIFNGRRRSLLLPYFCFVLFVWFSWNIYHWTSNKKCKVIMLFIYLFISTAKYINNNIPMNWVCLEHGLENHKTSLICSLRQFIG